MQRGACRLGLGDDLIGERAADAGAAECRPGTHTSCFDLAELPPRSRSRRRQPAGEPAIICDQQAALGRCVFAGQAGKLSLEFLLR